LKILTTLFNLNLILKNKKYIQVLRLTKRIKMKM
jgi:hypothetical protein